MKKLKLIMLSEILDTLMSDFATKDNFYFYKYINFFTSIFSRVANSDE